MVDQKSKDIKRIDATPKRRREATEKLTPTNSNMYMYIYTHIYAYIHTHTYIT